MTYDSPGDENDLVPFPRTFLFKLEIVDRPSTFLLRQIFNKALILRFLGCLLDYNLCHGFVEGEYDVLDFLSEL